MIGIRLALNAPSSGVAAREQMLIAKYGITAARAGFFPQLSVANAYTYNSPLKNNANLGGAAIAGPQSFIAFNGIREYQTAETINLNIDASGRDQSRTGKSSGGSGDCHSQSRPF